MFFGQPRLFTMALLGLIRFLLEVLYLLSVRRLIS